MMFLYYLFPFISCENIHQWRNSTFWEELTTICSFTCHQTYITHGRLAVPYHYDSVRCSCLGRGLAPCPRLLIIRLLSKQILEECLATGHELSLSHFLHFIIYIQRCSNNTHMSRLTTGIRSKKCVVRRFRRCANVI
jgi:hypothetical protein